MADDATPVADATRKPRPPTSPLTWAVAAAFAVAALVGGSWWYFTLGPGRTVDASGVRPGMRRFEVSELLGDPDEYVTSGGETAMRYGRTHVWTKGQPGKGDVVTEVTIGPRP